MAGRPRRIDNMQYTTYRIQYVSIEKNIRQYTKCHNIYIYIYIPCHGSQLDPVIPTWLFLETWGAAWGSFKGASGLIYSRFRVKFRVDILIRAIWLLPETGGPFCGCLRIKALLFWRLWKGPWESPTWSSRTLLASLVKASVFVQVEL